MNFIFVIFTAVYGGYLVVFVLLFAGNIEVSLGSYVGGNFVGSWSVLLAELGRQVWVLFGGVGRVFWRIFNSDELSSPGFFQFITWWGCVRFTVWFGWLIICIMGMTILAPLQMLRVMLGRWQLAFIVGIGLLDDGWHTMCGMCVSWFKLRVVHLWLVVVVSSGVIALIPLNNV